jgi:hypothetical protein
MATTKEKKEDQVRAVWILESVREEITSGSGLVSITTDYGKGITDYLRVSVFYSRESEAFGSEGSEVRQSHLTWAIAKQFGYSLRDRSGRWYLAISGGGYSKSYEIALSLARYYGIEKIRYEEA